MILTMHPHVQELIDLDKDGPVQKSEGWFALRRDCLTASALATALGVNKYEKPEGLILTKCGHNEFKGNEATRHGEKYEDEARILYEEEYDEVVHELGIIPHPVLKFLAGSPDGVTESGRLVEIKCPMARRIEADVPEHYMPQLQLLMEILDLDVCDFIQYKPVSITYPDPSEFVVVSVDRDRAWFTENLPIMRGFWDRVLWHREHGCQQLLDDREKRKRGPRKKKEIPRPAVEEVCTIVDDWWDEEADHDC